MRIIAGKWRGRIIQAPVGSNTRPTIDRVREALMSSLASARGDFEGAVVLDPFAGSGALGLEALSRGATCVTFYEVNRAAFQVVKNNITVLDCASSTTVHAVDVFVHPPLHPPMPFDLVLLDPPYQTDPSSIFALLDRLTACKVLATKVLVSYEHARVDDATVATLAAQAGWVNRSHKHYATLTVDIFMRNIE